MISGVPVEAVALPRGEEDAESGRLHFKKCGSGRSVYVVVLVDEEGREVIPEPTWYRIGGVRKLSRRIAVVDSDGDVVQGYSDRV